MAARWPISHPRDQGSITRDRSGVAVFETSWGYSPPPERPDVAPWRQLADRWALCGHPEGLLLSGTALDAAEAWAATSPDELTDVDGEFLCESRGALSRARRRHHVNAITNSILVGTIALVLVMIRLWLGARDETSRAVRAAQDEAEARVSIEAVATVNAFGRASAEATKIAVRGSWLHELEQRQVARSLFFAQSAHLVLSQDRDLAILLALEGLRESRGLLMSSQDADDKARAALYRALGHEGWQSLSDRQEGPALLYPAWLSPHGLVLTYRVDEGAVVWEMQTGKRRCKLSASAGSIMRAAWSPDGMRLLTVARDGMLTAWDPATGERLFAVGRADDPITSAVWSADNQRILGISLDQRARVWDGDTGMEEIPLRLPCKPSPAAWSPDGTRIAGVDCDGRIAIWDAVTGIELLALASSSDVYSWLAWASCGQEIVAWDAEATPHSWGATNGKPLPTLPDASDIACWSSGSPTLNIGMMSVDGGDHLYFAQPDALSSYACARTSRNLTQDEWDRYMGADSLYPATCPTREP